MRLERIASPSSAGARPAASISIAGGDDFARSLVLGQIVRGRVLRGAPGGRWLVDFDGRVKVVESAAPLRADEVVVGRVVALGEQVELQRVHTSVSGGQATAGVSGAASASAASAGLASARAARGEHGASAGRVLEKLGVERSRDALRALDEALREGAAGAMFPLHERAIRLATRGAGTGAFADSETTLPALLARLIDVRPDLGRRLLNRQGGGAIAHRVGTLSLLVDGALQALDLALFEQPDRAPDARADDASAPPRHREAVFAVTTRRLGRVEVRATIAGDRLRVRVSTPDDAGAVELARHAARLAADLEAREWRVDELDYRVAAIPGAVPRAVVGHLVAPGSVSVLA